MRYILSIDQSTSCTKALLFDGTGGLAGRCDLAHKQIVNDQGWVEHSPLEIWENLLGSVRRLLEENKVNPADIAGVGVSNQRETAIVWDKATGEPLYNAIVWQCGRGQPICERIEGLGKAGFVKERTGVNLSPYYSAAKIAWVLENVPAAKQAVQAGRVCCSTVDSWLVYKLTGGESVKTDYSNASRTQLMNIRTLEWDAEVCALFGLKPAYLPEICESNSLFGCTDFEGLLPSPVPIHGVLGDSHGALYGQGCLRPGMIKATYGTGSSVMMNIGTEPVISADIVTSLAWKMDGEVNYVLEGNLNYTGAVIKWLVDDLELIASSKEAGILAAGARAVEGLYLVPAFSGLGAPYWDSGARAILCGMDRSCGKKEIVRAAEECIAYQITDILELMKAETGIDIPVLKVDGGPTRDRFLMQFQADMAECGVVVPEIEELSGMGPAYAAGIALGLYDRETVFNRPERAHYAPSLAKGLRDELYRGWKSAVKKALTEK